VKEVLTQIEQESKFRFFYNDKFSDLNRVISIEVNKVKIEELLNNILEASDVTYKILDNNLIVITPKEFLSQQKVTGVIIDANTNEPLVGVSVFVQGTTTGTITDAEGKFSIAVPGPSAVLEVSYVGYTKKVITVGESLVLTISLAPELTKLDEVIVVGYGVQRKSVSTGAIGTIDESALKATSITQANEAFEGKVPGLQAVPVSGSPGSQINIRIRGYGSNGNSNPIYIVDGMITNDVSNLDPSDIATEEVLKEAASTAIYGAQAGNGVIMITTKKGEAGNSVVKYDFSYSWQTP
jgi:TonB-dependent SusC/RagA subfamily outer membrane receptor